MAETERTAKGTFAKGHSGNPQGRPPNKLMFTEVLRSKAPKEEIAEQLLTAVREGRIKLTQGKQTKYLDLSVSQWFRAVEIVLDRMEGKPAQRVDVTTKDQAIQGYAPAISGELFTPDDWPDEQPDDDV